jgi:YD repeat-containing protein
MTLVKIATGANNSIAIDNNGRVWTWGYNLYGQLGDNSISSKRTPVSLLGANKTFCEIAADGEGNSMAIDKNGLIWTWGYNLYGQLGINSIVNKSTPTSILGSNKTFCKIALGVANVAGTWVHAASIDKNGRIWAWGSNLYGQLGNNSETSTRTPVSILGANKTFCQITGGYGNTIAIDNHGRVWGWGYNEYGQLGTNNNTLTPIMITNI